jgi:hypothetical protein
VLIEFGCAASKTAVSGGGAPQFLTAPTVCSSTPSNLLAPLSAAGTNFGPTVSKLTFDKGSGKLLCKGPGAKEGEEITVEGAISGSLRVIGFRADEIIVTG